jgi:hypothetical protein
MAGTAWAPLLAAAESRIGVAAATNSTKNNPNVTGEPSAGEKRIVEVGTNMLANERIVTNATGQAQFLFNDGSSFSVGPDSDLTLDKFVFDPDKGTGEMSLSVTKGVLRFVGGKISKNNPVEVKAGVATMGIRGGIATFNYTPGQTASAKFLFGKEMSVTANGVTQVTSRPGTAIDMPPGQPPSPPRTVTSQEMRQTMSAMEAKPAEAAPAGEGGGGGGQQSGAAGGGASPPAAIESKLDSSGVSSANSGGGPSVAPVISVAASAPPAPAPTPVVDTTPASTPVVAPAPITASFSDMRGRAIVQGGGVQPYNVATFSASTFTAVANGSASASTSGITTTTSGGTTSFNLASLGITGQAAATLPISSGASALGGGSFFNVASGVQLNAQAAVPASLTSGLTGIMYEGYFNDDLTFFNTASVQSDFRFAAPFTAINGSTPGQNFDDTYSVRFFGFFRPSVSGSYSFFTGSDDSSLLWLGNSGESVESLEARRDFGNLVVNNSGLHGVSFTGGIVDSLTAGDLYPLLVYFGENGGGDFIEVDFVPPGGGLTNDGTGFFFSGSGSTSGTDVLFSGTTVSGFGYRANNAADFLFYSLTGTIPGETPTEARLTYYAGTPTPVSGFPTSGFGAHSAFGQFGSLSVPFVGDQLLAASAFSASPILSRYDPHIDPTVFGATDARAVLGQATLGLTGVGAAQESFLTGMTAIYVADIAADEMTVTGGMRGTARLDAAESSTVFASNVGAAETETGGNAVFAADAEFMVLTPDLIAVNISTGAVTRTTGATLFQSLASATPSNEFAITAAAGITPSGQVTETARTTRTIEGYAGGLMETRDSGGTVSAADTELHGIAVISTNAASNRLVAALTLNDGVIAAFGSASGMATDSAFINDTLFVARDAASGSTVNAQAVTARGLLVSHDVAPVNAAAFAPGSNFCTACSFIQWGWWTAEFTQGNSTRNLVHLATWVAGELSVSVPNTGTATYSGHAIGSVQNGSDRYVAMGIFTKSWSFATRTGQATISNFDSRTVTYSTTSANGRDYTAPTIVAGLTTNTITAGSLAGSLYRSPTDAVAGTAGSFTFSGANYRAAGTFVASR